MEVTDGVHVLPLALELEDTEFTLHPTAVETDHGVLLADVGWVGGREELEAALGDAGFELADVWGVVLTHQDADHAGGLADVVEAVGPTVFAHRECAPYVDGREHPLKLDDERYPAAPVDVEITGGDRFHTAAGPMDVVHTPGHAPGHVSLHFLEAGLLLSADALHAPEGELDGPRAPLDEDAAIDSIERLAELDVDRTVCYHGGPVEADTETIEAIRDEHAG